MRSHGSWAALAVLMLAPCLAFISLPAHAAEDSITNLVVNYDIQADGSVLVEHQMDWRFASEGRHGIDFSIVTRETWEGDADKDVVYDVSNIRVDSPSGAPDEFTERTAGFGSGGRIELRIGIPGSDSPMGVAAGVESFGSKVPSAASSSTLASSSVLADGGSGGSSGFSGDSSGGAGGGGTGSSSW